MKLRSTTPASTLSYGVRVAITVSVVIMAVAMPLQFFANKPTDAISCSSQSDCDAQIQALQGKISGYQEEANALRKKANTLQNALSQLSIDKAKIQTEINLYQAQYDQLVKDIKATEKRIAENRQVSGDLIVQSSLSEDVPLIVRLASSDNLADYIDGEVNRVSVREAIVKKTEENEKLKIQLKEKQAKVKKILDAQKEKRDELASKEAAQRRLLAETKGNESAYQSLIKSSKTDIKDLKDQQDVLRNANLGGGSGGSYLSVGGSGGYKWANAPYPCWHQGCGDTWGLYMRECVSYAAWRLDNQGYGVRHFGGNGHAAQWPSTTANYTQRVSAQKGTAMVRPTTTPYLPPSDPYYDVGHVAYVEEKYSNGDIRISEYNFRVDGTYSERRLTPAQYSGMIFLKFPRR